jgi:hypothetical protein
VSGACSTHSIDNAYILVERHKRKNPLKRPRRRWENNTRIKEVLKEGECERVNWTHLECDRFRWRVRSYSLSYNAINSTLTNKIVQRMDEVKFQ